MEQVRNVKFVRNKKKYTDDLAGQVAYHGIDQPLFLQRWRLTDRNGKQRGKLQSLGISHGWHKRNKNNRKVFFD